VGVVLEVMLKELPTSPTSFAEATAVKKATKARSNCFSLLGAKGFVVFVSFC
jgi:hypothetical protein